MIRLVALALMTLSSPDRWTDPATGKDWLLLGHSVTFTDAEAGCVEMGHRLPTLDEWWEAYDRIKDTELAQSLQTLQLKAWTADALAGTDPLRIWALYLQSGNAGGVLATDLAAAACLQAR